MCVAMISAFSGCKTKYKVFDSGNHKWGEWQLVVEPTCTEDGKRQHFCDDCKERETEIVSALGHEPVHVNSVEPTCAEKGKVEHYLCNRCEKTFLDAKCTQELTDIYIPLLEHNYVHHAAKDPTCTEVGWDAYVTCYRCDYSTYEEIPALDHNWDEWTASIPSTCTEKGVETRVCLRDGSHTETRDVDALGHNTEYHAASAATCTEDGNLEYYLCSRCEKTFADADCTTELPFVTVPATGHNYQFNSFVWTETAGNYTAKAKYVCENNSDHVEYYTATVRSEVTTAATCEEDGERTYTASYDGHTENKTETINKLGHNYKYNSFVWTKTAGNYTAKAKYICANNSDHVELYDATVNKEETTAATCEADGERTYTATYDGHTSSSTETLPKLNHNYQFDSFVWTETAGNYTAKAKYVCENNSDHVERRNR